MAELYVIGQEDGKGPVAIGLAEDARAQLAELQATCPAPLRLLRDKKLARGWDTLAKTILNRELCHHTNGTQRGWYRVDQTRAKTAADKAFRATQVNKKTQTAKSDFGPIMTRLRTTVFGCSMEVLATIAGTATSTVSRWEKGELTPGLDELKRLRAFAYAHSLKWSDAMLFEDKA